MNDYSDYITIRQFLNSIHRYTEWVRIQIVNDVFSEKPPQYLSYDVFCLEDGEKGCVGEKEANRILEYYGDFHVWNVHTRIEAVHGHIPRHNNSTWCAAVIEANVSFSEIRDAWYREKEDIRRKKRREREKARREARKNDKQG